MSNSPPTNLILWLDLPVSDLDRAITFYQEVLSLRPRDDRPISNSASFQFNAAGSGLTLLETNGSITNHSAVTPYFNCVNGLDLAVSRAKLNGGIIVQDIHSMEPFGFRAVLLDSEGNRIALHGQHHPKVSI